MQSGSLWGWASLFIRSGSPRSHEYIWPGRRGDGLATRRQECYIVDHRNVSTALIKKGRRCPISRNFSSGGADCLPFAIVLGPIDKPAMRHKDLLHTVNNQLE